MDKELIDLIKSTESDEEIKEIIDEVIDECLEALKEVNIDTRVMNTLGVLSDINNTRIYMNESDKNTSDFDMQAVWMGFIPNTTRIIYGVFINKNKDVYNRGQYYYLNDNEYLYEFSKYIKDKDIDTDTDFILFVYEFLEEYLGNKFNPKDRHEIHKLICKNNEDYFKPLKEHSNKDFVGTGGAMCTEYATLAQNILTVYGFDMMYMMDERHAYNLVCINDKVHVLDLSMNVAVVDINGNTIGDLPYLEEIENYDNDYLNRVVYGNDKFILNEYYDLYMNERLYKFVLNSTREYGIWGSRPDLLDGGKSNERIIKTNKRK